MKKSILLFAILSNLFLGCIFVDSGSSNGQATDQTDGMEESDGMEQGGEEAEMNEGESGDEMTENTANTEDTEGIKTEQGVYESFEFGDCPHIMFSCGDFGVADTKVLSGADLKLFNSLIDETSEMPKANTKLIGKKFEIQYRMTEGYPCQAGYPDQSAMTKGQIPSLLSFKRVN
ncbi:MAG: hypothetical protein EAZ57_08695 [Cytophagales bacterium]|nr:MAG: hypothetical protein EAZ67_09505 [Cytophagales bacterium]TAF60103.1 MAG: hypothetical protein EAZ57_08695 [Cytophagales bacterium]